MIKRFNLILIFILFSFSIIFSFGGSIPTGLPGNFGFGVIDKADQYAPSTPHFWKDGQGTTCWDYSYQYLTRGWTSWWSSGSQNWAGREIQYWEARGQYQIFTFYYNNGDRSWYQNASNMTTYFNDFKSLCQQINSYSTKKVIIHIEPDLIGFWRQANVGVTTEGSVQVGGSSFDETCDGVSINSLPNTLQGWSEALYRIRNQYASGKAYLAHHFTHWASGTDLFVNSHTQNEANTYIDDMTNYIKNIENNKNYDLFFIDPSDRDADWYYIKQGTATRWTSSEHTYTNTRSWGKIGYIVDRISTNLSRRGFFWQVPVGNTYFKTCNNSNNHFRDNSAQEFLPSTSANGSSGTPGDAYSSSDTSKGPGYWANLGIMGVLFGEGGYDEYANPNDMTHIRDWPNDGITNPTTNTNGAPGFNTWGQATSTVSDNDGGYIRAAVAKYCSVGKYILPGASGQNSPTRTQTIGPSPTKTPTFTISPTYTQTPYICSMMIYDGDTSGYRLSDGTIVQPTSTVGSTAVITEVTGGTPGNGMQIVYTEPAYWQQAQWRPPSPGVNTADHTHLRFEIRAVSGTVSGLLIVLNWTIGQKDVASYVTGGITTEWKTVVIPLADLIPGNSFSEINFINNSTNNYTIMVDNIRLTGGVCPTSTFTSVPNTPTFTRTRTSTGTPTGTNTPVITNTYTRTPTGTPTQTNTSIATSTYTWTRTATWTNTNTYIRTATPTYTFTRTNTFVYSPTATPSGTPPTSTNTPTRTNTIIPSTVTWTQTQISVITPTFTRTIETPIISTTDTPTQTLTHTSTVTNAFTQTRTLTPILTSTNTQVSTSTQTWTLTSTPSRTSTLTFTFTSTLTYTFTYTLTATSSWTFTVTPTRTFTSTPQNTNTYTQTTKPTPEATQEQIDIEDIIAYPNPVKPENGTTIGFKLTRGCRVKFLIYTVSMRLIRQIEAEDFPAGYNTKKIGREYLKNLANGIFYYVIVAEDEKGKKKRAKVEKLIIMR